MLRNGGSLTTVAATMTQEQDGADVPRLTALASYGDLHGLTDEVATTAEEPDLPPREQCVPTSAAPEDFRRTAPLLDRFDLLARPGLRRLGAGRAERARDAPGLVPAQRRARARPQSLLLAVDALPPVTFDLGVMGWAPTLELTVHVRARPAPGWLKLRHATRNVAGGYFEEDCEVWDSAGRLVAQSRQLARMPRRG